MLDIRNDNPLSKSAGYEFHGSADLTGGGIREEGNTATITKAAPADLFPNVNKKAGQKNLFF